ncbi:uncharacterized protein LOC141901737 [Tubulanus polymorphus]|uniref:uncharacterized protein LOC141901737 n=1 Tax=Tubulanus polymorphus TaxID=672921 RepID=UPI003DA3C7CA
MPVVAQEDGTPLVAPRMKFILPGNENSSGFSGEMNVADSPLNNTYSIDSPLTSTFICDDNEENINPNNNKQSSIKSVPRLELSDDECDMVTESAPENTESILGGLAKTTPRLGRFFSEPDL